MKNKPFTNRLTFAWSGIKVGIKNEKSLRTQLWAAVAVIAMLFIFQPELIWWALVGIVIVLVLAAELINTALENLADHLHPEQHPKIKIVKDCAAGAVLVLSIGALWIGFLTIVSVFTD